MKAKHDITYCINPRCEKKCDRHESHYEFEEGKCYSWQKCCKEYLERYGEEL